MVDLAAIEQRLQRTRRIGDKLQACCPFHDDATASFVVYEEGNYSCSACNASGDVKALCAQLGVELPRSAERRVQRVELTYDYRDRNGRSIARVKRIEEDGAKRFLQFTVKNGVWECKKHYPFPFYRLDELANAAPGSTVWVAEGEKCVDALAVKGCVATCCAGGSKGLPHADLSGFDFLRGKRVVILPDNDKPGESYAEAWRVECAKRGINAVIIRPPGLREKEDVYDFLARGGAMSTLEEMAEKRETTSRAASSLALTLETLASQLRDGGSVEDIKRTALVEIASSAGFAEGSADVTLAQAMLDLAKEIESGDFDARLEFGLASVDSVTGGVRSKGSLVILGGAPGAGKSAFAGQVAEHWALHYGAVHCTSSEMTAVDIAERSVARRLRRHSTEMSSGEVRSLAVRIADLPLEISARPVTMDWLESNLRLWHAMQERPCAAFVDYLQIIDRDSRVDDIKFVGEATRRLKALAMELGIVIVLMSQIKRGMRDGEAPTMEAFWGGTFVEANADIAAILWHDGALHVLKNRRGRVGKASTSFDKPFMTFNDAPDAYTQLDDGFVLL